MEKGRRQPARKALTQGGGGSRVKGRAAIGRSPTPQAPLTREGPPVKSAATTEHTWATEQPANHVQASKATGQPPNENNDPG